ncbi:hypothetical protein [Xanthomarina spongicola]|uniref:Uncharacterized protein n=1 Tax=Xanthomarina spongicola TaxID=570520 RepID=A0A316DJR4_9FLAO|nr:hypothetical protein [Xanthomarina spongicola]PWK17886.1 hypothetical protein LX78_02284 [Xanthomarina spongicola]
MKKSKIHNITNSGFKTPDNYFSNLEDSIISNTLLKEKIKETGFKVPDTYFDTLENTLLNKLQENKKSKVFSLFSKRTIVTVTSVAAAIVLMFNLSVFESKSSYDSLDIEAVENYILNENLDDEELASLFNNTDFIDESFYDIDFSDETIQDYINDNLELNDLYTD